MVFAWTAFISSLLLFLVQPMIAKAMLPFFGGSAGVWTVAALFFQLFLLFGYVYADWTARHLRPRVQALLHCGLAAASLLTLPVVRSPRWMLGDSAAPAIRVLATLASSVGLPYFVLSTTSPLVQAWRIRTVAAPVAYRLFAVSNAASLAALLAYPVLIEPMLPIRLQLQIWSISYAGLVVLIASSAWMGMRSAFPKPKFELPDAGGNSLRAVDRALWIALSACPSILWLAVSNTLSQHLAPIPFLWILPLGIYLLTFILCFHNVDYYNPKIYRLLLPAGWVMFHIAATRQGVLGLGWTIALFAAGLFLCSMFCHGELARRKPEFEGQVTSFYVTVAFGGAMGGAFVGLAAPVLFRELLELPVGIGINVTLATRLLYGFPLRRIIRLGVFAAAGLAAVAQIGGVMRGARIKERNFYGSLEVTDAGEGAAAVRVLNNGPIRHGAQFLSPARRRVPTGYYGADSGVGLALNSFQGKAVHVGVVGLGTGTLAAFGRPGDAYRFYEINPAVIRVARAEFSFLSDCPCSVTVVEGDGRLALEHEVLETFDVLAVDAFNGDSIPVHLLTREAFGLYLARLQPDGILAIHITNRYLDLAPVATRLASEYGRQARLFRSPREPEREVESADWVLVSSSADQLGRIPNGVTAVSLPANGPLWTDDHSDLFHVLR
jgi:hypothetical protein